MHAHYACLDASAKLAGCPPVPRANDGHVAERHLVCLRHRLLEEPLALHVGPAIYQERASLGAPWST
jgi:hypothetical protein